MFELKIADTNVASGSIAVSWCVDVETIKQLSDEKVADPQVVIVVAPHPDNNYSIRKETRTVVPLKDLMAYLEFKVPGENKIWGFISTKSAKEAKDRYLAKSGGEFCTDILTHGGSEWSYIFDFNENTGLHSPTWAAEVLSIGIPEACFAEEPSQWEKNWVNHFFRNKCADQCEFRRRRLFAYLVQPVILLLQQVLRTLFFLVAFLIGAKNISIKPLFQPLSLPNSKAAEVIGGGSYFIRSVPEDFADEPPNTITGLISYFVRKFIFLPFMPLVFIPLVLLIKFGTTSTIIGVLLGVLFAVLILGTILFISSGGARNSWNWICEVWRGDTEDTLWYVDQNEINLLTCTSGQPTVSFKTLPPQKKTLRLRFYNLKSKVCRPFSA